MSERSPVRWYRLALLGVMSVGGCGPPQFVDVSGYPTERQAEYRLFAERCSRCHGLDRALNARVAAGGWSGYVRRMSRHPGAGLSLAEQRKIANFLEFHHHRTERSP
jgi:hypothetical protein